MGAGAGVIERIIAMFTSLFTGVIEGVFQPTYDFITLAGNELLLIPIGMMIIVFGVSAVRKLWQGI